MTGITWRLYLGAEDQAPDSLIEAKQGAGNAPAYRGLAYAVFERLALANFGRRLPQLSFEVIRSIDGFEQQIEAITIIPGAGEFAYDPTEVVRYAGQGSWLTENTNTLSGASDWSTALDQLTETCPNARRASLVVSWFGTDLRAGSCQIMPKIDNQAKSTSPITWSVAGLDRPSAAIVSMSNGGPAYGGTPNDASVIAAIRDLTARRLKTNFYPFILMDIPAGNSLPDPYGGSAQAPYPWRGRITAHVAPGLPGSPDKTAAIASEVAAFVGTAQLQNFSLAGDSVVYSGPAEWWLRRMILHNAYLCKAAGGVDTFLIGGSSGG
jgi:hypothetical protein